MGESADLPSRTAVRTTTPGAGARRIDVHHHFLPPEYLSAVGESRLAAATARGKLSSWSVELSLALMEHGGIETSIVSTPIPNYSIGDLDQIQKLCRSCNELMARVGQDHPGRFGMFAYLLLLPEMDMEGALREMTYCLDDLGADGVALRSNYKGRHIGDLIFNPLWEEINRRKAVVHIHPAMLPGCEGTSGVTTSTLEYPFDTTRAIVSLLCNGTPVRFPDVKVIFSHAGGAIPYLAGRVASFTETNSKFSQRGFAGVIPALKNFYYDITDSVNPYTFRSLLELVPSDHLLFGSDVPFADEQRIGLATRGLTGLGLEQKELEAIDRKNALALFPRFQRI